MDCALSSPSLPNRKCSDCGIAILASEQVNPDRAVRRDIDSLLVKCRHTTAGCPWQGLLKHLDVSACLPGQPASPATVASSRCLMAVLSLPPQEHMAGCRFRPVPCPNSGCQQLLAPSELEQHASSECGHRRVVCQHCRLELTAHTLEASRCWPPRYGCSSFTLPHPLPFSFRITPPSAQATPLTVRGASRRWRGRRCVCVTVTVTTCPCAVCMCVCVCVHVREQCTTDVSAVGNRCLIYIRRWRTIA